MTGRDAAVDAFLTQAGWREARRASLAGDLSSRRYVRLRAMSGKTAILMDAPPEENPSTAAFLQMTEWLRGRGLSAPAILAAEERAGLLLLEDLGDTKVSDLVAVDPSLRDTVYTAILDLLILIRAQEPPPLPCPDAQQLTDMTRLADDHYPGIDAGRLDAFRAVLETVLKDVLSDAESTSLRDFHTDNMMWLPERAGLARLGLLDYQDAFITHPAYDLVSLLTDARTSIDPAFRERMRALYAERSGDDPVRLARAFAAFSAQRNLRILGIFSRAARLHGKTAHLPKLPRVHGYFVEALRHPIFADVAEATLAAVHPPEPIGAAT